MKHTTKTRSNMTAFRWISLVLVVLLSLTSFVACAAGSSAADEIGNSAADGNYYDKAEDSMSGFDAPLPEIAPSAPNEAPPTVDDAGSSEGTVKEEYQTKIIRTVTQRAQTKAFDAAIVGVEALVVKHGGYVENSYTYGTGYNDSGKGSRSAEYTIRIPAEQLDAFLSEAGELYVVAYNNSSVSNVTAQYYDIVTRLETLRAEQQSLQNMLEEAKDISTMLQIKDYLYQVIYEIESYETQLKLLDSRVSYSTVRLTIEEVVEYNAEVEQSWGERLVAAFKQSWVAFGNGFQGFTVFLVAAFPTLLVLGGIAAIVIVIVIKTNKKHRPKQPKDGE